jgi:hypothetical protein
VSDSHRDKKALSLANAADDRVRAGLARCGCVSAERAADAATGGSRHDLRVSLRAAGIQTFAGDVTLLELPEARHWRPARS